MLRQFGVLTAAISQLFFVVLVGFFLGDWLDSLFLLHPFVPFCSQPLEFSWGFGI